MPIGYHLGMKSDGHEAKTVTAAIVAIIRAVIAVIVAVANGVISDCENASRIERCGPRLILILVSSILQCTLHLFAFCRNTATPRKLPYCSRGVICGNGTLDRA